MICLQRLLPLGVQFSLFLVVSGARAQDDAASTRATEAAAPSAPRPSPLDVRLGVGAFSRHLHYTDTATDLVVDAPNDVHDDIVDVAALGHVSADWYPLAHFMGGPLAHVGLRAGFERSLQQKTSYDFSGAAEDYSHVYQRYFAGLRGRIPLDWFTLGIEATYGYQSVWVRTTSAAGDPLAFPDVSYGLVEGRLDGEARVSRVILAAYAGFAYALSVGQIGDEPYFPNAKAFGLTYGGHVGYQLSDMFDVLIGIDAQSFRLNFNPVEVDNPRIAGGASDRYLTFWAGLRFVLPGAGAGGGSAPSQAGGSTESTESSDDFDSFD